MNIVIKSEKLKKFIKKTFMKTGFQIKQYPDVDHLRRIKLINTFDINVLFDVGANAGQYADHIRLLGYKGKIISFEPLTSTFNILSKKAVKDGNMIANNYALGDTPGKSYINIAGNSGSSSILDMLPEHLNSAPESEYIGKETIEIKTFDQIFEEFSSPKDKIMLKIDTQGFEKNVVDGALKNLKHLRIIQLEMSLIPLYDNEIVFADMIAYMDNLGFKLYSLENGFFDNQSGRLLQTDGVFVNTLFEKNKY